MTRTHQVESAAARLRAVIGWRAVLLVAVMLSGPPLMALTFSAIAPGLPMLAAHFGGQAGGTMLAQWIMTTPAIGLMLGAPSGGWLIDRIGPRLLIIAALAGFAIGGSAGLWANDPASLLVGRFVMGFCAAIIATAATWLIAERYEEQQRRRLIAAQDTIAGMAAMSAVLLAGMAAQSGGWRAPFAIYLVAIPLLFAAIASVPAVRPTITAAGNSSTPPLGFLARHWPIYAIIVATAGLMMMPATQVPFLLQSSGVEDAVVRSRVIACSALLAIIGAALFPVLRKRLGEPGTLRVILLAYLLGTTTLSLATNALGAALGCAAMGIGTGLFGPFFASLLISRTEPALRGRAIGFMFGAIFLSEFLSPLVVLPLRAQFGGNGSFGAMACLLAAGLVASIVKPPFRLQASHAGT